MITVAKFYELRLQAKFVRLSICLLSAVCLTVCQFS